MNVIKSTLFESEHYKKIMVVLCSKPLIPVKSKGLLVEALKAPAI